MFYTFFTTYVSVFSPRLSGRFITVVISSLLSFLWLDVDDCDDSAPFFDGGRDNVSGDGGGGGGGGDLVLNLFNLQNFGMVAPSCLSNVQMKKLN